MSTWIIIALALLGVAAAVVAFVRTPAGLRYDFSPRPKPDDGTEYAEEYTQSERIRLVVLTAIVMLPLVLVTQFWGFPALEEFAGTAHCHGLLGINGTILLFYGLLAGLPLVLAFLVGVPTACVGGRIVRERQYPPPGRKVLRATRIRRGRVAIAIGYAHHLPLLIFLGLAVWGEAQAERLLADFDPIGVDQRECVGHAQSLSEDRRDGVRLRSEARPAMSRRCAWDSMCLPNPKLVHYNRRPAAARPITRVSFPTPGRRRMGGGDAERPQQHPAQVQGAYHAHIPGRPDLPAHGHGTTRHDRERQRHRDEE